MTAPALSRRATLALGSLAVLPLLAWYGMRLLGLDFLLIPAAGAVCGAVAVAALFIRPRWGAYALAFWVYAGISLFSPVDAAPVILAVALAAIMLGLLRGDENAMTDRVFWIALLFFVLFSLQSGLVAEYPSLMFRDLFTFGKALAVVIVIVQVIRTPGQLRMLGNAIFAGAVATVIIGIMAIRSGQAGLNYMGEVDMLRFSGSHGDPNTAASIMCSALPFGFFAVYHERGLRRVLSVLGVITLIVATFDTFSRGALFSIAVVLVAFVAREVRGRRSFIMLAALLGVGLLLTPGYYWTRAFGLASAFEHTTSDFSVYTRLLAFQTAVEMFVHHPLTGIGLGNFIQSASYRLFIRIVTHNTYLDVAVGVGIFGLFAFLAMLGTGFRHAWRGARREWTGQPKWMNRFSFYAFLSMVSIAISGLFLTFSFRYQLWIPVAVGLVIGRLLRGETPATPTP